MGTALIQAVLAFAEGTCYMRSIVLPRPPRAGDPCRRGFARSGLIVTLALLLAACWLRPVPRVGAQSDAIWDVQVGGDLLDQGLSEIAYSPSLLTVHAGDTVRWTFAPSIEQHTVTFTATGGTTPPAYVPGPGDGEFTLGPAWYPVGPTDGTATYDGTQARSSGTPLTSGDSLPYRLSFSTPGTYTYTCSLHTGMFGFVSVLPVGAQLAETPAQAQQRGQAQFDGRLTPFRRRVLGPDPSQPGPWPADLAAGTAGSGSSVVVGLNLALGVSALQYLPSALTVHRGERVTFYNADGFNLHSVTFSSGDALPEYPEVRTSGDQPELVLTRTVASPSADLTYTGQGYLNSGVLRPGLATVITFDAPAGTYTYACLFHREAMQGTITVVE